MISKTCCRWRIAKHWHKQDNCLARYSSHDLDSEDFPEWDEVLLQPGDMLYMPRGKRKELVCTRIFCQSPDLVSKVSRRETAPCRSLIICSVYHEVVTPSLFQQATICTIVHNAISGTVTSIPDQAAPGMSVMLLLIRRSDSSGAGTARAVLAAPDHFSQPAQHLGRLS